MNLLFIKLSKALALILLCSFTVSSVAQNINVTGKVADDKGGETMPGATVMLLNPSDSSFYKFGSTNVEGKFSIKGAKAGKYILQISFIGYNSYYQDVSLNSDNKSVDLGTIKIKTKQAQLKTFEVVEEVIPVIINGDTIEFNAAAFKTQPEDNVAALLKKLPGVEVESDGTVKAQGETVEKVLIDGKEFFGDDTKTATENLPADMVKSVQVYDDFSDASKMTGIDDGDRTKTINLKIKKDRKKGVFGNITAGGGSTAKGTGDENGMFNNKLNINKFKDDMQLSVLGMYNNANEQGFSYRDYINFSGGGANAFGGGGGGSSTVPLNNNPNDGFTTTTAGGVNWNKDITPKINFSSSYFYNQLDKNVSSQLERQYITDSTDFNTLEQSDENQFSRTHSFRVKYDQKIDSTQDLKIRVNMNYSEGNALSNTSSESNDINNNFLNSSINNNQSDGTNLGGDGKITYGKRFQKKGRSLVANVSYGNSDNVKRYLIASQNSFADGFGGIISSTIDQIQDENNKSYNYSGKVSYTEPIGKRKYLELSYQRSNFNSDYIKDFFDIPAPNQEVFNTNLSLAYNNNYDYDNYKMNLKFNSEKSKLTIGSALQKSTLEGKIVTTNFDTTRINWNVLPRLKWNYSFTKSTRLNFNYTTNVQEPSLEQLQPTIDNSNPLNIFQGNPNLIPEYRHNVRLRLMSFNSFSFVNIFGMLSGTYTKNKITNSQTIDNRFVQTTTPVNVDDDYSLTAYIYFGSPIRPLGSKINIRVNSTYNKSILFVNTVANDVNRYNNGIDFSVENRGKEIVDIKVGTKISHNITSYSISSSLDQKYLTTGYYSELFIDFLKTWTFSTRIDYTQYSGDQFADNPDIPIWRAHISKRFLKGKSGLLKLSVYDIFNQNIGINRTSQLNYIEDERVTTLSRYVMLSFTYKVRRFGGKKKKTKEEV